MNSLSANVKQSLEVMQPVAILLRGLCGQPALWNSQWVPHGADRGVGNITLSHHLLSGKGALHRTAQCTEGPGEAAPSSSGCMLTGVEDAC